MDPVPDGGPALPDAAGPDAPPAVAPPPRRAALAFVYVTVVLDVLAFGIIIPTLPPLVVGFAGATASGAEIYGLFAAAWALMQFLFSPVLGALSDRFGRRPVLILSALGLGLDYVFMALAPSLAWLFVGRVISGITAASFPTAGAYIADVTPPEGRARAFGKMGAAWGVGFIMGPALGGLLGGISLRLPFWAAASLSLASAVYGFALLPESLPKERRSAFSWRKANPLGSLKLLRSHPELTGLASVSFLNFLAFQVLPSTYVIYAGYRFGWGATMVGLAMTLVGVCNIIVQGGLTGPVIARLGERRTLLMGLLFGSLAFIVFGLAPTPVTFLAAIVLYAPIGLAGPSLQALMSRRVSPYEQGKLQGANSSIMALTGVVGPGIFTFTFAAFIGPRAPITGLSGAPFLVASGLMLVAWLVALRVVRGRPEPLAPPATPGTPSFAQAAPPEEAA